MKRCPQCGRIYPGETVIYCLDDGALLSASDDPQATLVLPQARPTDPFPNLVQPTQPAQPQIVRQGVRPAIVYALVALLAMVVAGGAVALYYERGRSSATSDANNPAEMPAASPTPTRTEAGNRTQPTPEKTAGRENAGGSVPGKYPEGSTRLLTYNDVAGKSTWELKIMKNEIYARHGYIFKTPELRSYFESQPWYKPMSEDVTDLLNNIEIQNAAFIKGYE
jgi:hypothetical protein